MTGNINVALVTTPTVISIATSKALPNTIVVATDEELTPRFTTDGGQNWQPVVTTPWVTSGASRFYFASLGLAPRDGLSGRRILYDNDKNIYRSGDLGET